MLQYIIRDFFKYMGSTGWNGAETEFTVADFGLLSRLQETLAYQNRGMAIMIGLAVLILTILIIICTITIIKSQSKTRKMLRELIEIQQKKEPEEDNAQKAREE